MARLILLLLLAACGEEQVGQPTPPSSFGRIETASAGCPGIDGTYFWPAKQGSVEGYLEDGKPRSDRYATPVFFGVSFQGDNEFRVKREAKVVSVAVVDALTGTPSHSEVVRRARNRPSDATLPYECTGGWVVLKERVHPHPQAQENYGGPALLGAKMAPLADGGLVVAQWIRVTGRRGSIFTWGERSVGTMPLPDKVHWRWSRFERVAP